VESDLIIIDCIEKLRGYLFSLAPSLETKRESLLSCRLVIEPPERIWEAYVAVFLQIDTDTAAGRRKVYRIITQIKSEMENPKSTGEIYELPEKEYNLLLPERKARIHNGIKKLGTFMKRGDFGRDVEGGGWACAARLDKTIPGLGGIKAYRFLRLLGAPVAVPESPKRTLLFRLGWIKEHKSDSESLKTYQDICFRAARLCGETVHSLDYLLGLFSGSERANLSALPVCGKNPYCEKCDLTNYCEYYRFLKEERQDIVKHVPIVSWLPGDQPRECLERLGAASLSDAQLLAIILRTGSTSLSALDLANTLLHEFSSLHAIEEASVNEICRIRGIGRVKAIEIKAAVELGKRFIREKKGQRKGIEESQDVFHTYRLRFTGLNQETFVMLILNSRNQVMKEVEVSKGSLNSCTVHPREVFKEAIRESGSGVIFIHNHPSGDSSPSRADIMLTERLKKSGEILGIRVLDHIIVGEDVYYSFADEELL